MKTNIDPKLLYQRIAVGVDDAGNANEAVRQAVRLAAELGARLEFVHAVEIPPSLWPGVDKPSLDEIHATALRVAREQTLDHLARLLDDTDYDGDPASALKIVPGHGSKVLLRHAEEQGSELLMIGPHAKRRGLDFGSTSRALISKSSIPVWTQVNAVATIERILVPVDLSDHSRLALMHARALAERLGARVRVMHSYAPPEFAYANLGDHIPGPTYVIEEDRKATSLELDEWMSSIDWGPVVAEHSFLEGIPAISIQEQAPKHDLVVMGTHGRSGLSRFLIGSVAQAALKQAETPVLVVPSPRKDWQLES